TLSAAALDNTLSVKCCPRPLSSNFNPYPWRAWSWKTVPQSFSTTSAASSATLNDAAEQSDPDICSTSSKGRKRDPLLPRRPRNPLPRRLPHRTPRMARSRRAAHRPPVRHRLDCTPRSRTAWHEGSEVHEECYLRRWGHGGT